MDFATKIYSAGGSSTTATPSTTPSKPGEKRKSSRPPAGGLAVNILDVHNFQVHLLLNAALNNLDFLIFQVDLHPNLVDQHPKLQLLPLVLLQKRRRYTGLTHRI